MAKRKRVSTRLQRKQEKASEPEVSIVSPVYNEEASLEEFHRRVTETLQSYGRSYEINRFVAGGGKLIVFAGTYSVDMESFRSLPVS